MRAAASPEVRALKGLMRYAKKLILEINGMVGEQMLYYAEAIGYFRLYVLRPPELRQGGSTNDLQVFGGFADLEGISRLCLRLEEVRATLQQ